MKGTDDEMDLSAIPDWAAWGFTEERLSADELLYPGFPDDYFRKHGDMLVPSETGGVVQKYLDMPVRPFIKKINLNGEDGPRKDAFIAGVEIDF